MQPKKKKISKRQILNKIWNGKRPKCCSASRFFNQKIDPKIFAKNEIITLKRFISFKKKKPNTRIQMNAGINDFKTDVLSKFLRLGMNDANNIIPKTWEFVTTRLLLSFITQFKIIYRKCRTLWSKSDKENKWLHLWLWTPFLLIS
jgi:hypothetical protein